MSDDLTREDMVGMIAFAVIAFAFMVAFALYVPNIRASRPTTPTTPTAGGCPLDAVSYAAPVWMPECTRCQRVTDRITRRRWWLLTMSDGAHVVLPLDEMEVH